MWKWPLPQPGLGTWPGDMRPPARPARPLLDSREVINGHVSATGFGVIRHRQAPGKQRTPGRLVWPATALPRQGRDGTHGAAASAA